ncbi:MAG: thrombospondin type 3 repeat-containing protein [bacterium]
MNRLSILKYCVFSVLLAGLLLVPGLADGEEIHPSAGWQASDPTLADTDGDGLNDLQERIAGTNPRDGADCLKMLAPSWSGGVVVRWASASNRVYRLDRSTNLVGSAWETLSPSILALPPMNVYTDEVAKGHGPYFYRVGVVP